MENENKFTVFGHPEPQGSMRAFVMGKRAVITSNNKKLKPWRQMVSITAMASVKTCAEKHEPVYLEIDFYLAKPASVPRKRQRPSVKPDIDKLLRGILDALTGIAFKDDGQVCEVRARKHYDAIERTEITILPYAEVTA